MLGMKKCIRHSIDTIAWEWSFYPPIDFDKLAEYSTWENISDQMDQMGARTVQDTFKNIQKELQYNKV